MSKDGNTGDPRSTDAPLVLALKKIRDYEAGRDPGVNSTYSWAVASETLKQYEMEGLRSAEATPDLLTAARSVAALQPASFSKNAAEARLWATFYEAVNAAEQRREGYGDACVTNPNVGTRSGVCSRGTLNCFNSKHSENADAPRPAPNALLTREVKPVSDFGSAVAAFKLAMQAGDDDSALGHAMQMLSFVDNAEFVAMLAAARTLDEADRKEGPGSDEEHAEAECAIWEAAIKWSRATRPS